MWIRVVPIGLVVATLAVAAAAQTPQSLHSLRQPYDIETFGAFRMLVLAGDFSPKVGLGAAMAKRPTIGVGAVADARGEITIHDGELVVSYGREGAHPEPEADSAGLLTIGKVPAWQTVTIDRDVAPGEIESFLSSTAAQHGLDGQGPFPFQVRGTLLSYVMHVNAAPTNGPHGMGQPIAITAQSKGDALPGEVAGFYVSPDLVGIVSHGGERTHSHWIAPDGRATAHLEAWGLKSGAQLRLPRP